MADLEPPKDAELKQAVLDDYFNADQLARAGAVFPRQQFAVMIYWKQADSLVISEVLSWLGERGPPEIELFLQGVIYVQPNCPKVKAFCGKHYPGGLRPLSPDSASRIGNFGLVREVTRGLRVLSEQNSVSDFSSTLGQFRAKLQETGDQIRLLKKYKGLHNCLHNLQGQLLGIEATVSLVGSGGSKGLRRIAFNLKPLAGDARAQTTGLPRPAREIEWIDEFDSYIALMMNTASLAAPTKPDIDKLSDVPNLLRALLHQQSPRINSLLIAAADALKLESFADAMAFVATGTSPDAAQPDTVLRQQLIDSAAAVNRLQLRMMALVDQHYDWQDLNTLLDEAESSTKHQPQVRIPKWDSFRIKLGKLCGRYPDEAWSSTIMALMAAWIAATPSAVPGDAEKIAGDTAFDAFYRACVDRFVNVDSRLNDLSDEVTEVARPLDTLLSQIPRA